MTPSMPPDVDIPADLAELDPSAATILIVDDNEQNLELIHAYVEELESAVCSATDGMEALALVKKKNPDLILLDVMMPRMSGFEVCEQLKADPATREIPIIMVTALNEVGDVERAVEAGADDFLTKPVNKVELLTRVKSLLRVRLLRRQLEQTMAKLRQMEDKAQGR